MKIYYIFIICSSAPIFKPQIIMNSSFLNQHQRILRHSVAAITPLVCALLLPMVSLVPAAPIDQSFQYDALNRLTAAGATNYQHDAVGNLVLMTTPVTPSLFVTPSTRTVTYTANSATTVSLTANVSWTASSSQAWLTVTPASGTTGATLALTATTQNPTTSTRSAIVTITGGSLTSQVTVTQDGSPPANTLTVTPTSLTVLSDASSVYGCGVSIPTGAWTSVSDQPWLTLTSSSGSGNGSILFTITENTTAALRTAHITVTSGIQTAVFTLYQQASSVVDDHGGSIATATAIPTTASSAIGILTAADEDFFCVTVPGPGILIAWSESSIDTYGHLYNPAGNQLDEDNDSNIGANFRVSAAVTAGNYYIRMRGNAADTAGAYILRTRFIPSAEPIQVSYLEKATNDINLGFTGSTGVTYYILGSDDLKSWTQITTMTGTGAENYATLVGQGGQTKRFFRVSTESPVPTGFAYIPSGSFQMGDSLDGITDASPARTVNVSAFYMAKYEVTKEEWDAVNEWGANHGYSGITSYTFKGAKYPILGMLWHAALLYCNARSEKDGLTPCYTVNGNVYRAIYSNSVVCNWQANGYRLPTEAEWEKAARGGSAGLRYPWGNTISHQNANCYISGVGRHPTYDDGTWPMSSPVGSFAPNGYGLYDMVGNGGEWCWDWYGVYLPGDIVNPRGAGTGTKRVKRGGSCENRNPAGYRCAERDSWNPVGSGGDWGFRIARSSVL